MPEGVRSKRRFGIAAPAYKETPMKMAKASEADMNMAMDLVGALDILGRRWSPCMPEAVERLEPDDELEHFDRNNDEQCGRAMRHLLDLTGRASLGRVIFGMAVLLDPINKVVDPASDTLEHHPETVAALAAMQAAPAVG